MAERWIPARRFLTVIQSEDGYPANNEGDGRKPPTIHTAVLADEYDKLHTALEAIAAKSPGCDALELIAIARSVLTPDTAPRRAEVLE